MKAHYLFLIPTHAFSRYHFQPMQGALKSDYIPQFKRVVERLISILEDADAHSHIVSAPAWSPHGKEQASKLPSVQYEPSARAATASMPFRLESSNPNKVFVDGDWKIYVVDLVSSMTSHIAGLLSYAVILAQNQCVCVTD